MEPYEKDFRVRFRIDGILYNMMTPPLRLRDAIISRIKIMAKMDISEKRLPQDGRIKIRTTFNDRKKEIDYRVSSLPTLFGEKIVLRILDRDIFAPRHEQTGLRRRLPEENGGSDSQAVWDGTGDRAHGQRKDIDAVCGAEPAEHA